MNQLRGDLPMARALQGLERRVGSAIRRALLLLDGREDICAQLGADLVEHAACLERGRHDRREFVHTTPLAAASALTGRQSRARRDGYTVKPQIAGKK